MNQWKRAITPLYYRCCAIPNVLAYINTILSSFHNSYTSSKMVYIQSSLRILCIRSSSHRPYTSPNYNLDDAPSLRIITCHPHNVLSSLHFIPTSSFTLNTHLPTREKRSYRSCNCQVLVHIIRYDNWCYDTDDTKHLDI